MPQKTAEKGSGNQILAKDNNSGKSKSSMTKLERDRYYVNTNPYTKLQVNISRNDRVKSGKLKCDGVTDGLTD